MLSDVVEGGLLGLKVTMWLRRFLSFTTSLTDQGCKSVSVSDGGGFFDGARHVVVGVAEFVGQEFDLVRGVSDAVVKDGVPHWGCQALLSGSRHKEELVGASVSDGTIDHSARHRVLEGANISSEDTSVDSLGDVDVHEWQGNSKTGACCFYLLDLRLADSSNLAFTDTVSVEDQLLRVVSIRLLESLERFDHSSLKRVSGLLP